MENMQAYGPWAIAFCLLLLTFKDTLLGVFGHVAKSGYGAKDQAFIELARSVDKLANVLERLERTNEKALDHIATNQQEMMKILQVIDLRTQYLHRGE